MLLPVLPLSVVDLSCWPGVSNLAEFSKLPVELASAFLLVVEVLSFVLGAIFPGEYSLSCRISKFDFENNLD